MNEKKNNEEKKRPRPPQNADGIVLYISYMENTSNLTLQATDLSINSFLVLIFFERKCPIKWITLLTTNGLLA